MSASHVEGLADGLVTAGVRHAFGVTGSGASFALIGALKARGCRYVGVGHEAAAALMAGACGRDGRLRAAAITIKGPGFVNLLPGIMSNAWEGRASVSVSEAYASDAPAFRKHKRARHRSLAASLLKGYARVEGTPEQASWVRSLAEAEYPGPVHLDLGPAPEPGGGEVLRGEAASTAADAVVDRIRESIRAAARPLVVLGSFAARFPGSPDWNRLHVPVVTTAAAKGVYDERLPWSAGVVTGEAGELAPERSVVSHADLVVGIGLRNDEVVAANPFDAPAIFVDVVAADAGDGFGPVQRVDAGRQGADVFDVLLEKEWGADLVAAHRDRVASHVLADAWQLGPALRTIAGSFEGEPVLVVDTGFFCTVAETIWLSSHSRHFCGSSVGRFMGTGIPTALGIALADPATPVVALFGDGGVSPYFGEIRIAVHESLPILFAMASDGRYGSVAAFTGSASGSDAVVGGGAVDWWQAARALGCESRVVDGIDALEAALSNWRKTGPLFLQMPFEPGRYDAIARRLR